MLKNGAQWCARQKYHTIEQQIIQSYFGFHIGSIYPNFVYLLFKKRKKYFHLKKIRKMREISKKKHKNAVLYLKIKQVYFTHKMCIF